MHFHESEESDESLHSCACSLAFPRFSGHHHQQYQVHQDAPVGKFTCKIA